MKLCVFSRSVSCLFLQQHSLLTAPHRFKRRQLLKLLQEDGRLFWVDIKEAANNAHCMLLSHFPAKYAAAFPPQMLRRADTTTVVGVCVCVSLCLCVRGHSFIQLSVAVCLLPFCMCCVLAALHAHASTKPLTRPVHQPPCLTPTLHVVTQLQARNAALYVDNPEPTRMLVSLSIGPQMPLVEEPEIPRTVSLLLLSLSALLFYPPFSSFAHAV